MNYKKNSSDISTYIRQNYPETNAASGPSDIPVIKNNANFVKNIYYNLEKEFETKKKFCKLVLNSLTFIYSWSWLDEKEYLGEAIVILCL